MKAKEHPEELVSGGELGTAVLTFEHGKLPLGEILKRQNSASAKYTNQVLVEDRSHAVMTNIASSFVVEQEEWYTYYKSPRPSVHELAHVDEATYWPDSKTKMGDHLVIWTNQHMKARNECIFMGHHPELFENPAFTTIFHNAILGAVHP